MGAGKTGGTPVKKGNMGARCDGNRMMAKQTRGTSDNKCPKSSGVIARGTKNPC